jgi:hypothetical protein
LWKSNILLLHLICIHFREHLLIYGLVEILLLWCFHQIGNLIQIYPWFFNLFLHDYHLLGCLKISYMMINNVLVIVQLYFEAFWGVKSWTWINFIHTYNMYFFCVLVLKVVAMYCKPLLVVTLKKLQMHVYYVIHHHQPMAIMDW